MTANEVADVFNESGWQALAKLLVARLGLQGANTHVAALASLPVPGQCRRVLLKNQWGRIMSSGFGISIRHDFLDDPFAVVAILSHELCHAIYSRCLAPSLDHVAQPGAELLEEERTIDLLVFMFQLGEFQMRVARKQRLTLGYFNQSLFERMHVILNRKRQTWQHSDRTCGYCGGSNKAFFGTCSGCGLPLE